MKQTVAYLLERVELHIRTLAAIAVLVGDEIKLASGRELFERVADAAFRHHDDLGSVARFTPIDYGGGGAYEIGEGEHRFGTLGMRYHFGLRMRHLGIHQSARGKRRVDDAGPLPDLHVLSAGLALYVCAKVAVRQEEHGLFARNGIDDLHRVARGA